MKRILFIMLAALLAYMITAQTNDPYLTRFSSLDANADGKLTREESSNASWFDSLDKDANGVITTNELPKAGRGTQTAGVQTPKKPHVEQIADMRAGEPPLKKMPDGDASRDAAGRGQLFESIIVTNFTSIQEGLNGFTVADLNGDGLVDIIGSYTAPSGGLRSGAAHRLRVFINEGNFRFRPHAVTIRDSKVSPESFGGGQIPHCADFNGDGFLDIFVTRNAQMIGGVSGPRDEKIGNGLYISDGAWDRFRDVSPAMGIQNETAYNRAPSIGDVNKDGWLDIAVGCDNIGNAMGGVSWSRLFIFKPKGTNFFDGKFEDIGGSDLVPDFGGFYHDSKRDKAGPCINLRDIDNDGDLDLIQSYHVDIRDPTLPYSPVEYRQGVFTWRNMLAEEKKFRFVKLSNNGLACEAHCILNDDKKSVTAAGKAPGLPYISFADADNDGLFDVLAVGPADPGWAPRAEYVSGRFWHNLGGFKFEERTEKAGLISLTWTYREWWKFFDAPEIEKRAGMKIDPNDRRPYFADAIFGDYNNDGWVDCVVQERYEKIAGNNRAVLYMNKGDGTFVPKPTTMSGLDGMGVCGEAADLNNDGLIDIIFAADPDNTGGSASFDRYESKVYWNTGFHGARENHWLRLRFRGVSDASLIGTRVEAREASGKLIGMRTIAANHSYKSGGALDAHFGLGKRTAADIVVTLLNGKKTTVRGVKADSFVTVDLVSGKTSAAKASPVR